VRIDAPAAAASAARLPWIDAWRGVAILAMIVYHFSWDLRHFGFIAADVAGGLGWIVFARLIAGSFLFLVGVSLVLATRSGIDWRKFSRRLAIVAVSAAAVTAATYFAFPESYVFFGILHHIAVASLLGLAFLRLPLGLVAAASAACFLAPVYFSAPLFDAPALVWIGLGVEPVRSNDFVPLFPWFGVVLAGIVAARLALAPAPRGLLKWFRRPAPRPLLFAGRYSLAIYLIHQPLLFGLAAGAATLFPPAPPAASSWFPQACLQDCLDAALSPALCEPACACLTERVEAEGLDGALFAADLSEAQTSRYRELSLECRSAAEQVLK
jgi:uncharacterized membrane protein